MAFGYVLAGRLLPLVRIFRTRQRWRTIRKARIRYRVGVAMRVTQAATTEEPTCGSRNELRASVQFVLRMCRADVRVDVGIETESRGAFLRSSAVWIALVRY